MLTIEWTGVAGFRIEFEGRRLLIDPFVTRPNLRQMAFTKLQSDESLCAKYFPEADWILVGHTHYDHVLDVPTIAAQTGAHVYGSASTAAVCDGAGVAAAQIHEVAEWTAEECGPFRVTFVPSLHNKIAMGKVPFAGEVCGAPCPPLHARQYKEGGTFGLLVEAGGFRIYHCGSADFIAEEATRVGKADLLLPGIAGRKNSPGYLECLCRIIRPNCVIPNHHDNFFIPVERGFQPLTGARLETLETEIRAGAPEANVVMPEFFKPMTFDTAWKKRIEA